MTLRLRLVLAVVALAIVAQGGAFAAIFYVYRNSEYQRLDTQLRSSERVVDLSLDQQNGLSPGGNLPGRGGIGDDNGGQLPSPQLPLGTYGQLRDSSGKAYGQSVYYGSSDSVPDLPAILTAPSGGRIFTVGAKSGSGSFRVYVVPDQQLGYTVIAIPTTEVANALRRLVLIEAAAIGALLIVTAAGAWFILRRGLRPLERMAATAASISAGDMSQRVTTASPTSEVGQLGLALNTMLDDIEAAFAERDATEQKLRQFLADASHELRTPLTSIQGFAELFRLHGEEAKVELPTILRRIEEESARMKVLVEDLLLLARLDEHRDIERKPTDLVVLAADACTDAVATDPGRAVTLDAPGPLVVEGDEVHLRQALGNLVSNALRHTPPGTPLEIGCRREGNEAVVTVRDHGPGLDEGSLAHVFDRFWQGDKARVGTGAGLGLSIVAAIASEHGGRAEAVNAEGGGAEFRLVLPASVTTTQPV
ncbi:MAG TPA: HAMP domain-containing sensor histidine kinase [Acidimicrobiales bacterium]|nr:HAMP domain-containing sensor histidine kinase [Acidimicrobiales bacterium]